MEESKREMGDLQWQGQRRCREAIGKSYAILGNSSDEMGVKMSEKSRGIRSLNKYYSDLGKHAPMASGLVACG